MTNEMAGRARPGLTILLAGRDDEVLASFRPILAGLGFSLVQAESLAAAEAAFREHRPGVVVIREDLPGGGGLALGRRLREATGESSCCFLVLLFNEETSLIADNSAIGVFDDVLGRPWKPLEIQARLRTWERVVRLQQDLQTGLQRLAAANALIMRANERMKKDLYAVAKIQTSLLPATLPALDQAEFAWVYKPRSELAGDGLNVFRLDEHQVAFYVLDVAGSGTSAALLSVSLSRVLSPFPAQSTLLKELIEAPPGYRLRSPSEVLAELNRSFPIDLETKEFFTILYGIYDLRSGVFRYASAGHPMPIVLDRRGRARTLAGGGYPIGFVDEAEFAGRQTRLHPGDRMFLFSDGLAEAMSPDRIPFGKGAMLEAMRASAECPLKEAVERVLAAAEAWCGEAGLHDDVSLLAVEIKTPPRPGRGGKTAGLRWFGHRPSRRAGLPPPARNHRRRRTT